ncbi:MAG: hypothetical protein FJX72_19100 [Armatimonadetes bacterium]|nr:hypothetical protein [Armatimonadota bacterium]
MLGSAHEPHLPSTIVREGLAPRDIVFVLFRRRWILLAVALPIVIMGIAGLLGRTKTSTAATRVVVEFLNVERPQWNITGRNVDFDRELSTLANIAMSVSVAEDAALALADSLPVIQGLSEELALVQSHIDLRDLLLGGLDVTAVGESNILEFRHTDPDPRVALMSAGAIRNAFMHYENYGRRKRGAAAYYEEQTTSVKARIDSLLAIRGAVLGESGFTSLEDELRYSTGDAAETANNLRKVVADREQLQAEYDLLKSFLDRDPREFPAGQDESRASTLVGWRDLVGKQEDALNSILSVHTDDSIPARRQRALLERSLERLRAEEVAYTESLRLALEGTIRREQTIRSQLETIRRDNERLPEVYQKVAMLDSEIKSLRDLLEDLQGQWGEVRMNEMADDRVSNIIVLTEPELIESLGGGKSAVYMAMIVVLALALGVVGAFVAETTDHRVYAPREVEDKLKLPVFASVKRID